MFLQVVCGIKGRLADWGRKADWQTGDERKTMRMKKSATKPENNSPESSMGVRNLGSTKGC